MIDLALDAILWAVDMVDKLVARSMQLVRDIKGEVKSD
jgi:hypothetical protein